MKKLLSVGCSNTLGVDLEEEIGLTFFDNNHPDYDKLVNTVQDYRKANNFSTFIANKLKMECVNLGISGASNERIIFNLVGYLESNSKPDFILLNLSGQSRTTIEYENKLLDIDVKWDPDFLLNKLQVKNKNFKSYLEFHRKVSISDYNLVERQKNLIKYANLVLSLTNIPYIISNTIPSTIDLGNITDKSVDISFDQFNEEQGRKRAKNNHWLSDSHQAWGSFLLNKIKNLYPELKI